MRVKAKRTQDGFLIPLIDEYRDKDEIEVEIVDEFSTDFLIFLKELYEGKENIFKNSDDEVLSDELKHKYGL
ncbi:hypothetical protein [Sulfurihydrogenibium sp.]|uniref:hypothetical protein n=1 Tax=Sulfurihydrogenibium sp. TaxID=2053621 RepID=UPI0026381948|nr:hypothetical protein [Sulfurihydrogenibium sp.]